MMESWREIVPRKFEVSSHATPRREVNSSGERSQCQCDRVSQWILIFFYFSLDLTRLNFYFTPRRWISIQFTANSRLLLCAPHQLCSFTIMSWFSLEHFVCVIKQLNILHFDVLPPCRKRRERCVISSTTTIPIHSHAISNWLTNFYFIRSALPTHIKKKKNCR